jgi:hypothetical protein
MLVPLTSLIIVCIYILKPSLNFTQFWTGNILYPLLSLSNVCFTKKMWRWLLALSEIYYSFVHEKKDFQRKIFDTCRLCQMLLFTYLPTYLHVSVSWQGLHELRCTGPYIRWHPSSRKSRASNTYARKVKPEQKKCAHFVRINFVLKLHFCIRCRVQRRSCSESVSYYPLISDPFFAEKIKIDFF